MTVRMRTGNRRPSEIVSFTHDGIACTGSVSFRPDDWQPFEVFLDAGKPGSAVQATARDTAVAASLALQYGCPPKTLRDAMTRLDDGTAAGPLGRLLDLIAETAP